jgi:succinyl-CoA synthetase beta subunit
VELLMLKLFPYYLKDPNVKAILINILVELFVVTVVAELLMLTKYGRCYKVPIIVRLQGTNAAIAKELIIQECQFYLHSKQLTK